MPAHTLMLHVRVDDQLKAQASEALAGVGLTISDPDAYDAWFRTKVCKALDSPRPSIPHAQVMQDAQAVIDAKRRTRS